MPEPQNQQNALAEIDKILTPEQGFFSRAGDDLSNYMHSPMLPLFISVIIIIFLLWGLLKVKWLKPIAKFYSIQGRVSRKIYWIWWFAMLPLFGGFAIFFAHLADVVFFLQSHNLSPYWGIVPLWILFLGYIPYICIQIRRLHDMNLSGNWFFLALITNHTPLVVVKWLILGCVPGTKTANKFGEPVILETQHYTETSIPSKWKESAKRTVILNKVVKQGKVRIFISFVIGVIVGASAVYALSNRYVSYPSFKWNIVRIDRLTGKTEIASARDPSAGWTEVKEK